MTKTKIAVDPVYMRHGGRTLTEQELDDVDSCPVGVAVMAYAHVTWDGGCDENKKTTEWVICKRHSVFSAYCEVIHDAGYVLSCEMIGWLPLPIMAKDYGLKRV